MTGLEIINQFYVPIIFRSFPEDLYPYLEKSNPLFAGIYHDEPFCLIGLVPQHVSGIAAIWGWNTPLVHEHPLIYARWAHRLIKRVHTLYPTIIGECSASKVKWLLSLGADFLPRSNNMYLFRIEAPQ